MMKDHIYLCCVGRTEDKISSPKLLSYKVKNEEFFPLNWTPQHSPKNCEKIQSFPSSQLLITKHQIISSADKETQTETIESIASDDGSNYSPSVLPTL